MGFVTQTWALAWLAAGAAAAAVPVVIHLIHLARAPEVPFPTLRFLRSAAERTARRRRLENLFLMIVRMLLVGLLALALARPFLSEDFGLLEERPSSAAVLVLDNSYSMNVRHEQATRFSRAKQEARAVLESPWRPTLAAVLLTNPRDEPPPEHLTADRADLFRRIDDAQVSTGRADLVGAVRAAYRLLDRTQAADKRLWIITDRQALSWQGLGDLQEPRRHPDVPVAILRPTEPSMANVAVTRAAVAAGSLAVGMPVRFDVTVANAGRAPAEERAVLLFVDDFGLARAKHPVRLAAAGAPGGTQAVSFTHVFEQAGLHKVLVALEGADALDTDDARRIALVVADRLPVLVVKERAADVPFEDPNFYLVRALDPLGAEADVPWAIRPEELAAADFETARLDRYAAVLLNNVAGLQPAAVEDLADYVARGRTLVLFCGPDVRPDQWNRLFIDGVPRHGGLLPARLKGRAGDAVLRTAVERVTQVQGQSPLLEGLVDAADIYQDILVYEYFRTEGAPPDAVLARLSGGDPLLIEKTFGQGRVLLFTTAATTDWTTLPIRNLFLPLLMRIVHLSARGRSPQEDLLAGRPFEVNLYPEIREPVVAEVTGPLGPAGEVASEQPTSQADPGAGVNLLRFAKTWNLGYYTWRLPQGGTPPGLFATNPDAAESDLAELADDRLRADFGAPETHVAPSLQDLVARFEDTAHRELWQYFLMVCLVLAFAEPLIANWMRPEHVASRRRAAPA